MSTRALNTVKLLALAGLSSLALAAAAADELPAQVGRVALTQGQVSIADDVGAEMTAAQVNWPVTSGNMISTAPGARTELRIGSTSIRLDGDSSLEVLQLDDASLRLRLHYGSANIRVRNQDLLAGFELTTAQARIRLQQAGSLRIDAERARDTSSVDVFDGVAIVEGGGSQLTVRAGKRADFTDDDVRTASAQRDAFDEWSAGRDRAESASTSARYVGTEMTGYEDLDRYGSWSSDNDYGPIWMPSVAATWVPYRDGSWTWLDPWGWTWVDNAPWGYAPFHYGRWIQVRNRWAWAPGRRIDRPVWAPALVGWVGGAGWDVTFRDRTRGPGLGWYPLSWHDRYVPGYRAPENHLRWLNQYVRNDPRNDPRRGPDRNRDYRPQGLTVVPQDRFRQPGRINVTRAPIATAPPVLAQNAAGGMPVIGAPPAPPNRPQRGGRPGGERDGGRADRGDRGDRADGRADGQFNGRRGDGRADGGRIDTGRVERDGFTRQRPPTAVAPALMSPPPSIQMPAAQGLGVNSPPPHQSPQPGTIVSPPPRQQAPVLGTTAPVQLEPVRPDPRADWRSQGWQRSDRREQMEELRRNRQPMPAQIAPVQATPQTAPQPVLEARSEPRFEQRPERGQRGDGRRDDGRRDDGRRDDGRRGDGERPGAQLPQQRFAPPSMPAPAAVAPPPRPAMPAPQPVAAARPSPAPAAAPATAPQRADPGQRAHRDQRGQDQRER
jgi:hypothetical protein